MSELMLEKDQKNKILQTFLDNFNAMPKWLKNTLIISVIIGVFYFGFIRKEIIYSKEKQTTTEIYNKINSMNKKIEKIEEIRLANADMLLNIEEVRGVAQLNSELHNNETEILVEYLKKTLSAEDFLIMRRKLDEENRIYREKVNDLFVKKSQEHLKNNRNNKTQEE